MLFIFGRVFIIIYMDNKYLEISEDAEMILSYAVFQGWTNIAGKSNL